MTHERRNMNENNSNDLQTIITQVIEEMKSEQGGKFDPNKINLAEMGRRTGLTRVQLRRIKANGFLVVPHALTGRKAASTIISGYTGVIEDLLKKNVSNFEVILERIQEQGHMLGKHDLFAVVLSLKYLISNDDFKDFKCGLARLIKRVLKQCPHITRTQLLKEMGFPENWEKINRYKLFM